jgi:organic hydroperoxide reductase OsmC/OhrA
MSASSFLPQRGVPLDEFAAKAALEGGRGLEEGNGEQGLGRAAASCDSMSTSSFLPQRGVPLDQFAAKAALEGGRDLKRGSGTRNWELAVYSPDPSPQGSAD